MHEFPTPLTAYPPVGDGGILHALAQRIEIDPFNAIATGIFLLALLHTFLAPRLTALAHRIERAAVRGREGAGHAHPGSIAAGVLHLLGEVEVVFGAWAVVLLVAIVWYDNWDTAKHYLNDTVTYTEALFVVVVMALASTRPIVTLAEVALRRVAGLGRGTPSAWWVSILILGPLLGSLITEPAAMTICALLLARKFYALGPAARLKYATLGLLFVNVSIGGTLTDFAAPPVLMVARPWEWDTPFMLTHFGWRSAIAIVVSTVLYAVLFRREFARMATIPPPVEVEQPDEEAIGTALLPVPAWLILAHVGFMVWTVFNSHYPALFIGGFFFFLGFARSTAAYQHRLELRTPLLVGFFLAGLVIHGGLQGWWITAVLQSLSRTSLFLGATFLTAFNDNALITYLATLAPNIDDALKFAVVSGAVVGGGLTVIANAPNPAGQALLSRFFDDAISPIGLAAGALIPTIVAALAFLI
jgi:hypothetical protein